MPFIVPEVVRFSLRQEMAGRPATNILDMLITGLSFGTTRSEAIADQAKILWNQWCDDILPRQANNLSLLDLVWLDLDNEDGETGSIATTAANPATQLGNNASQPLPINTCCLVKRAITGDRSHRSGRLYVAGYTEDMTTDANMNQWAAGDLAAITSDFGDFLGNINQAGAVVSPAYTSLLSVVHILTRDDDGHPLTGDSREVTSLTGQLVLATQRRRLRS